MLRLVVNGEAVLEYQPQARLPGHVMVFLSRMDSDIGDWFSLAVEFVAQPDDMQRVHFVALQLFQSFRRDNHRLRAASCAWLCQRVPELCAVQVEDSEEEVSLELVMNR